MWMDIAHKHLPSRRIWGWTKIYARRNEKKSSTSNFVWCSMVVCSIHSYFCWNFRWTNLSVIKVGNTVTVRAGNTGYVLSTYTTAYMEARPVSPCCKADSLSAHTQPYYWWYSFTSKNLTWWGAILWWPCYSSSCFLDLLHCLQNVSVYDHRPILFSVDIGKFVQNRVLCL